jgi:hypothetical protein
LPEQSVDRREAIICARESSIVVSTQFRARAGRVHDPQQGLSCKEACPASEGNPAFPRDISQGRLRGTIMPTPGQERDEVSAKSDFAPAPSGRYYAHLLRRMPVMNTV